MNDLDVVRRLAVEPTDESISRTWYRIVQHQAQKAPKRRLRPVPAIAGLAVLLVLGASLVIYRTGAGTLFPVASTPDAIAALNAMADVAATGTPVTVADGQSVRTETTGLAGGCGPDSCQLEPQIRHVTYDPHRGHVTALNDGDGDGASDGVNAQPYEVGLLPVEPEINRPTLGWLASLPTDPRRLLSKLRKDVGHNDTWSVDHQVWDAVAQLYAYCEIVFTPAQRATMLRALAGMTGLSTRDLVVDGVALIAIRHSNKDSGREIIFDPMTGHAVGRGSVFLNNSVRVIQMPGGPVLDEGVAYQATWKQTIIQAG
ncbi:MAG TPA: hypothetical protein VF062_27145 [Candidatus Limnocylindrales bacterium]